MANIKISNLHPTGSELFSDFEGYMADLGDSEFDGIYGGLIPALVVSVTVAARASKLRCASVAAAGVGVVAGAISGWITGKE